MLIILPVPMVLHPLGCRVEPHEASDEGHDFDLAAVETGDSAAGETSATAPPDEDGDGYSAEEGDCDDADAAVFPDAREVAGDGIDQDCDDRVDEVRACTGGGDFATIQEAIDAAPDGGVVEICSGVWDQEPLDVRNRSVELVGVGEVPGDVVLAYPSAGWGDPLIYVGGTEFLTLRRMALRPTLFAVLGSLERIELEDVEVEGGSVAVWGEGVDLVARVSRSRFASAGVEIGSGDWNRLDADLDTLVVEAASVRLQGTVPGGNVHVRHGLFVDSALTTTAETVSLSGNTFVGDGSAHVVHAEAVNCDNTYMQVYRYCWDVPAMSLADNLFASASPTSALIDYSGYFYESIRSADISDLHPSSASGNVLWDIDGTLFQMHYVSVVDIWSWDACDLYDTQWSATFEAASSWTDPAFTSTAGYGSYDPTATPFVGAFAGGDWADFPWLIP